MRRVPVLATVTLAATAFAVGSLTFAGAASSGSGGTVACVKKSNGDVRIPKTNKCASNESVLVFGLTGQNGAPGPAGANGAAGAPGAPGAPGKDGSSALPGQRQVGTIAITGTKQGLLKGGPSGTTSPVPISSFSYEVTVARDPSSGAATSSRKHQPVCVTLNEDPVATGLFQSITTNETLKSVVIEKTNAAGATTFRYILTNAGMSDYAPTDDGTPGLTAKVKACFAFQKIELDSVDPSTGKTVTIALDDWNTAT